MKLGDSEEVENAQGQLTVLDGKGLNLQVGLKMTHVPDLLCLCLLFFFFANHFWLLLCSDTRYATFQGVGRGEVGTSKVKI